MIYIAPRLKPKATLAYLLDSFYAIVSHGQVQGCGAISISGWYALVLVGGENLLQALYVSVQGGFVRWQPDLRVVWEFLG